METLDPNGERGRSKPRKRRTWADALMRPQTVKVLLFVLAALVKLTDLTHGLIEIFRK
jgi:hypothetical protein